MIRLRLMLPTINNVLNRGASLLETASLSPFLDAEILLAHALHKNREWLLANQQIDLTTKQFNKFKNLIARRSKGYPVAYLVGHKEFFGLDFLVTPDVLIPRPETELLVERAIQRIMNQELGIRNVIDIGTGSGNIIISLAIILSRVKAAKNLKFLAVDSSFKALNIARLNARHHGVSKKIKFLHSNLLAPLLQATSYNLTPALILANLPYLTKKQLNNLTIKHEPRQALYGGRGGLEYFRELFRQVSSLRSRRKVGRNNPKVIAARPPSSAKASAGRSGARNDTYFTLLLEHDPRQKQKLQALAKHYFPKAEILFHKDLGKKYRVCELNF